MRKKEREEFILDRVDQSGVITVDEICSQCGCSPATARRDLRRLVDQNLVSRIHGGAVRPDRGVSLSNEDDGSGGGNRNSLVDRVDILVITPNETTATKLLVERAQRLGVPLVSESIPLEEAAAVVAIDDYGAGVELGSWVGKYAKEQLGEEITVLDITCDLPNTTARSCGFADGLHGAMSRRTEIISVNGRGLLEESRRMAADALTVHPEINVIFGINDDSAIAGLEAYRQAGMEESRLLVVSFGLEGTRTKLLLQEGGPYKAAVAMFPELIGRLCIDSAVCAYHGCRIPQRLVSPFSIVTQDTLPEFYAREPGSDDWLLNWSRVQLLTTGNIARSLFERCAQRPRRPNAIGYVEIFSFHEWYQNVQRSMEEHTRRLGIQLKVVDASYDAIRELKALKRAVGQAAAATIQDGDTVIVDGGTTTRYLAQALRGRNNITVITNSIPILSELGNEEGITLISCGGVVRPDQQILTGPGAEATFHDLRADKTFITASGFSRSFGLSTTNVPHAMIKRAMISAARNVVLLIDHTKVEVDSLVKVAPAEAVHQVITDAGLGARQRLALTQVGLDVVTAEVG